MKKMIGLFVFLTFVGMQIVNAQSKTVTGTVTGAEDGLGIPGVSVIVKGTTNGVSTDINGKYSLKVNASDVLLFSFVGMISQEITVGSKTVINVVLKSKAIGVEEVVVTAMGLTRDKKSIGFAVQDVGAKELEKVKQSDAISALAGKTAGVQISSGSSMSGSNRILIRGANSIFGENQPLFIVDGVPMDNGNYNSSGVQAGFGGVDYGNMLNDLNPDDIANISVLKGTAAALYGSRAANGVIMITTKSGKAGKDKVGLTINSSVEFESIHDLPGLQREYGGGAIIPDSKGGVNGFQQVNINGKTYNVPQYAVDESWGPKYDPNLKYLPWYAFDKESFPNYYLKEVPWVAPKHDVEDFFDTGVKYTNSVAVTRSGQSYGLRFGFTNTHLTGVVPNSSQNKNSFSVKGNAKILDKLKVNAGINFSRQKTEGRPTFGYADKSFSQKFFQWGQRQLDFGKLKDYKNIDGSQRTWNRKAWNNPTPNYADNPYWTVYENYGDDERDRFWGNVSLSYEIMKGLNVKGSVYADTYTFQVRERTAVGSQSQSSYYEAVRNSYEYNYELTLNYVKDLTEDLNLTAMIGANKRTSRYTSTLGSTNGGLVVPGLYDLNNSKGNVTPFDYLRKRQTNSTFASVSLGYADMLFLDLTARNDWSSTLPDDNNSFFYPSVSLGFLFSRLTKESLPWLSFGKLRLGWSEVGNDTEPYRVETTYPFNANGPFQENPRLYAPNVLNNSELKPERTANVEVGIDLRFLKNRVGLEFTWYKNNTTDQIIPLDISKTTGYSSKFINAGEMENKGVELTLKATPVKTEDFSWDLAVNYSSNKSKLLSIYTDKSGIKLTELQIARAPFSQVYLMARVGEAYGQLVGYDYAYDENGNRIVDADGYYVHSEKTKNLGSVMPDYNLGIRNSFTYKNFDFSFLLDIQKGGKYFSLTHLWGMYSGMLKETATYNANGKNIREPVKDGGGILLNGVHSDGSRNETYVPAQNWAAEHYYSKIASQNVFDADYVKLREVTLGYTFPDFKFGPFTNLRISAYGKNLLTFGLDWDNFDPETSVGGSGNIQGIDGGFVPATRCYGFNVQFGF